MGSYVLKFKPEVDRYVYWSDTVEAPVMVGNRVKVARYLIRNDEQNPREVAQRMARADARGTSSHLGWFDWNDHGLIFEQRGICPRDKLEELCDYVLSGRPEKAWDLLEPFEDGGEVRRG